ncbi:hypothetical protein Vretifemale_20453 [Volvox reticuliferus]|nr:hypothetical protein Vretifemale_20453 [Volvox reticuliferus]
MCFRRPRGGPARPKPSTKVPGRLLQTFDNYGSHTEVGYPSTYMAAAAAALSTTSADVDEHVARLDRCFMEFRKKCAAAATTTTGGDDVRKHDLCKHRSQASSTSIDRKHCPQASIASIDRKHCPQASIASIDRKHRSQASSASIDRKHRPQAGYGYRHR